MPDGKFKIGERRMSNLSTLELREKLVFWWENLSDKERVEIFEKNIPNLDEFLTPIYCKLNKIIME